MWKRTPQNSAPMSSLKRGVLTLSEFCSLRAKEHKGTAWRHNSSTSDGQTADPSNLVSADGVNVPTWAAWAAEWAGISKTAKGKCRFRKWRPSVCRCLRQRVAKRFEHGTASAAPDSPPSASTATESFFAAELVKPRKPSVFSRAAVGGFPTRFWRWRFCRRKDRFSVGLPPPFRPQKPLSSCLKG